MDEITLVKHCQQGDLQAFEALVKEYAPRAVRTAYLITGRKDIAEDIAQEAFIQCYREIGRLRHPEAFRMWFHKILVRVSWRFTAREKGHVSFESLKEQDGRESLASSFDVAETAEVKELQEAMWQALNGLSTPLRTTAILRFFNGLSIEEIARVLDCRAGTVKSRLHNAKHQLAQELRQQGREVPCKETETQPVGKKLEYYGKECKVDAV